MSKYYSLPIRSIVLLCLIICISGCGDSATNPDESGKSSFSKPEELNDGWQLDVPLNVGLDETRLNYMLGRIKDVPQHKIHSIIIIKDNKLVFEKQFSGFAFNPAIAGPGQNFVQFTPTSIEFMASVTKSVTSVLAGIAYDKGYIKDVNDRLSDYYPEYSEELTGTKSEITIHHTLSMTSGLKFDENTYPYGDPRNDISMLFNSSDPIKNIFASNLVTNPGAQFFYNSGSPNVIANLISKTSGTDFHDFAQQYLFNPLGIEDFLLEKFKSQNYFASGGLHMSARNVAKIGSLFLNRGKWNGTRILSEDWIEKSTLNSSTPSGFSNAEGYGYYWWLNSHTVNNKKYNYFYAAGWGEQYMFIVPEYNMIVVFTSGYWNSSVSLSPFQLLHSYILSAIE